MNKAEEHLLTDALYWNISKNGLAGYLYWTYFCMDKDEEICKLYWFVDKKASDKDVQDAWHNNY